MKNLLLICFALITLTSFSQKSFDYSIRTNNWDALETKGDAVAITKLRNVWMHNNAVSEKGAIYHPEKINIQNGFETEVRFKIFQDEDKIKKKSKITYSKAMEIKRDYTGKFQSKFYLNLDKYDLEKLKYDKFDKLIPGNGFTFLLNQTKNNMIGFGGEGLGYSTISKSIAVAIYTEKSVSLKGYSYYIAVLVEGKMKPLKIEKLKLEKEVPTYLNDNKSHWLKVVYKDGSMTIYLDNEDVPVFDFPIDLPEYINEKKDLKVGFTASTNTKNVAVHQILGWKLKTY